MDPVRLTELLEAVRAGSLTADRAADELLPHLGGAHPNATVDAAREARCGYPEVVFCAAKTTEEVVAIASTILATSSRVLLTRVTDEQVAALSRTFPDGDVHRRARVFHVDREPADPIGAVSVISAGTSDAPVAEEAAVTASALGAAVDRIADVGVAGVHRVLSRRDRFTHANAIVVVAGMEGALPSLVAGLVDRPVIAVPTSTGYGAAFGGVAALLGMLTSCASGVTVVNIDNGFGAGYAAATINRLVVRGRDRS